MLVIPHAICWMYPRKILLSMALVGYVYCVCSTFGGDFNLSVWLVWLQPPNLMFTKSTYNHMYYQQYTLNIILFSKLKSSPMCITSNFTKLIFVKYTTYMVLLVTLVPHGRD